ncbi:MAG: RICIN domain-containing protein [Capsulimonas sp.]
MSPVSSPNSCLDVTGISTADGAYIQQWTYWGGAGQQWSIINP